MANCVMTTFAMLTASALLFFSGICTAGSDPIILSTTSQCALLYDNKMPRNATQTIPTDQLPTASTTTYYSIGLVKTIVLTPAPSATTTDLTTTIYDVTTLTSGSNLTSTVYTRTVTVNDIPVSTKTYTTTVNETVSTAATITVPALAGYTPLGAQLSSASARFITESDDDWAVQDEYWDKDAGFVAQDIICNRGWYATGMSCYFTVYTADFSSTATVRRDIPAQTLTRTRYVKRESATRTVWASPTSPSIAGAQKPTISTELTVTSRWATYEEATTVTSTATLQVHPSTVTAHAGCAPDNLINALTIRQYDDSVHVYPLDRLRVSTHGTPPLDVRTPNVTSALECCARAASEPEALFYTYQAGECSVWIGKECPAANSTALRAELWWSAQAYGDEVWREDGMVVGNGACGGIHVTRPYEFLRD